MKEYVNDVSEIDRTHMERALAAAENGLYTTTPNPRVGCVLVREGEVLAVGWHKYAGGDHAEVDCLKKLERSDLSNTDMYVTMEPCCYHGLTPSCVDRIAGTRIRRLVVPSLDPNPLVSGKGLEKLRSQKIIVQTGILSHEAISLNCGFFKRMICGRPWVRLKMAFSLDGRTALSSHESKWITNEKCRSDAHHWRARSCGVITGIGTVLKDNPSMDVRHKETTRQPTLIILDSHLKIPLSAKCLTIPNREVIVAHISSNPKKQEQLAEKSISTVLCPAKNEMVSIPFLLQYLGKNKAMNELTVEAGATVNSSFYSEEYDELVCYVGNKALGDQALPLLKFNLQKMSLAQTLKLIDAHMIENDIRLIYHHPDCILYKWHNKLPSPVLQ